MSQIQVMIFGILVLLVFTLTVVGFWVANWVLNKPPSKSPYSNKPLRAAEDLSTYTKEKILYFIFNLKDHDNRVFDINKAAFCRETGRLFTDAFTWYGTIDVDWSFLQKRYPGNWVSWGFLTDGQQEMIQNAHHSIEGFQTDFSSVTPSPRDVEPDYALTKPGPLYVDLDTKMLLGWKNVEDSRFEVLILQRPKGKFDLQKD